MMTRPCSTSDGFSCRTCHVWPKKWCRTPQMIQIWDISETERWGYRQVCAGDLSWNHQEGRAGLERSYARLSGCWFIAIWGHQSLTILRRLKLLIQFAVVGIWDPHGSDGFPSAGQRWGFHMISPSDLWVLVPLPSLLWTNGFPEGRNYQPLSFSTSAGTSNYLNVHVRNASICIQMHFVLVEPTNCRQL